MKLLRKDVLKWLRNLKSGRYKKGKDSLVSKNGTRFCCLGVWADQHGCKWNDNWKPLIPGTDKFVIGQGIGSLNYRLAFGLTQYEQWVLADLNDDNRTWKQVIDEIEQHILPRAV